MIGAGCDDDRSLVERVDEREHAGHGSDGSVETELTDHIRDGVREQVRSRFTDIKSLEATDIADAIAYAVTRPAHVSLNEVLIRPTEQVG